MYSVLLIVDDVLLNKRLAQPMRQDSNAQLDTLKLFLDSDNNLHWNNYSMLRNLLHFRLVGMFRGDIDAVFRNPQRILVFILFSTALVELLYQ